jgi:hypothetical protein
MIKSIILFSIIEKDSSSLISLPVSRNPHFLSCLQTILQKHITQRTNLVVSFPACINDTMLTSFKTDTSELVTSVLRNINGEAGLPVHVHQLDTKHPDKYPFILTYKPDSYVILTFPVMEIEPLLLIVTQVATLWYHVPFSPHARFIFVVTGCFANIKRFLKLVIYNLWYNFKISNLVFMIPRSDSQGCDVNEDMYGLTDTRNIYIYSWFPYRGNYCTNNFNAVLMDQCGCETVDTFLHNYFSVPEQNSSQIL